MTYRNIAAFFHEAIFRKFDKSSQNSIRLLNDFLSGKASRVKESNQDYLITTAFRYAVEKFYGRTVQAVFYPSVMSDNYCMNVAVNKNAVDEGYIQFDYARMYKLNTAKHIVPITQRAYADKEGYLQFTYL